MVKEGEIYFLGRDKVLILKVEEGKTPLIYRLPNSPDNYPFYYTESLLTKRIKK